MLDSKGRLFGKLNILDLGAALIMVLVVVGIFFFPGTTGSMAQINTETIEFDVLVRGLSIRNPQALIEQLAENPRTSIIVRNQPSDAIAIEGVELLERQVLVPQPDGSVKSMPEPRTVESFSTDFLITLQADAQITAGVPVVNQSQIKIGTPIELDGTTYNFKGSIIEVRNVAEN
ncbi:DUF4330 domain-containing protein [Spirulina major CS-329]|jgi:hypothetical protein|uniref:DUF4330 domain-containing protein n=1 Tax=Spirulina TaxID=1154 RepID=UPI00232AEEB2|nr:MULTISPECIES: DUF4330 domain-containing protein [Spirulina]MDB9493428.1 DUF4330 domain-containing protein [Spirulina subsalsa CS-330]MDB9503626.1 DUF4330 domain-containing protein [Spirulina major CS-329]